MQCTKILEPLLNRIMGNLSSSSIDVSNYHREEMGSNDGSIVEDIISILLAVTPQYTKNETAARSNKIEQTCILYWKIFLYRKYYMQLT